MYLSPSLYTYIYIYLYIYILLPNITVNYFSPKLSLLTIQSSAAITRPNDISYYMNNCRNGGKISIRSWIHKRHPIPRPSGRAMGCLLWIFMRKETDRVITAPHGIYLVPQPAYHRVVLTRIVLPNYPKVWRLKRAIMHLTPLLFVVYRLSTYQTADYVVCGKGSDKRLSIYTTSSVY